jgi:hypothetical protein
MKKNITIFSVVFVFFTNTTIGQIINDQTMKSDSDNDMIFATNNEKSLKNVKSTNYMNKNKHPKAKITVMAIKELPKLNYDITAHSVISGESIILNIDKEKTDHFKLLIFDIDGNIWKFQDNLNTENQIEIHNLNYDTYFMKIYKNSRAVKIFRITKNKVLSKVS